MARVGARPAILPSSRPRLMIEERARFHRVQVPHPRPEPVDGRNQRTKGRGEGGVTSDMTDKARSTAKAPTLPDTQRRGGWGTRAGGVCDAVEDSCAARRNRWCHPEPRRSLPGRGISQRDSSARQKTSGLGMTMARTFSPSLREDEVVPSEGQTHPPRQTASGRMGHPGGPPALAVDEAMHDWCRGTTCRAPTLRAQCASSRKAGPGYPGTRRTWGCRTTVACRRRSKKCRLR